jgi:Kdo2-lipid IVA lauroyltransferase/acyltransferase
VIVDLLLISILKAFQQLLRIMPERVQSATGVFMGRLAWLFLADRRSVAYSNVSRVFPNCTEGEKKGIVKRSFEKLGINFIESLVLPFLPREEYETRFTIENGESVEDIVRQNKGIITLVFHYANWEIMGVMSFFLHRDVVALAKPLKKHVRLNEFLNSLRRATGLTVIPNAGTGKDVIRYLRQNWVIALLADQREKRSTGVNVELFGEKVPTTKGIAIIGMKTGAPVIPVYSVREGFLRYRVVFSPPLVMERNGNIDELIYKNTRKINMFLESIILKAPDEWFWVHRRWGRRERPRTTT